MRDVAPPSTETNSAHKRCFMSKLSRLSSKSQKSKSTVQPRSNSQRKDRPMKKSASKHSGCDCELCTTESDFYPLDANHREPDESDRIVGFFHCAQCLRELSEISRQDRSMSPSDFQEIQVGYTDVGIQVWCKRHNRNIAHFDLEGMSLPPAVKQAA